MISIALVKSFGPIPLAKSACAASPIGRRTNGQDPAHRSENHHSQDWNEPVKTKIGQAEPKLLPTWSLYVIGPVVQSYEKCLAVLHVNA
jgi:hypothetical protein